MFQKVNVPMNHVGDLVQNVDSDSERERSIPSATIKTKLYRDTVKKLIDIL